MSWSAGIDVGGTFTDLIAVEARSGEVRLAKVPTTPENQAFGVLNALAEAGLKLSELALLVHGTTTTTNALLERKLARTGLITTRGFRDVLELGRRTRPRPYGLTGWFEPLIPRELRCEAAERIDAEGEVITPLDESRVEGVLNDQAAAGGKLLQREGIAVESVRLLFSADMQFQGQSHILTVALPAPRVTRAELQQLFERAYFERFGVELPEIRAVLVNLHTAVIGVRPRHEIKLLDTRAGSEVSGERQVWFPGGWRTTPIYRRESLPARFQGPAIIEQLDCTTVLEPGNRAEVDGLGNLLVTIGE